MPIDPAQETVVLSPVIQRDGDRRPGGALSELLSDLGKEKVDVESGLGGRFHVEKVVGLSEGLESPSIFAWKVFCYVSRRNLAPIAFHLFDAKKRHSKVRC